MRGIAGFPPSMMPNPKGQCRLLDGTVIVAAGEQNLRGDPFKPPSSSRTNRSPSMPSAWQPSGWTATAASTPWQPVD